MEAAEGHRVWSTTELWGELNNRDGKPASQLISSLPKALTDIEVVLNKGGTTPLLFTLHDAGHSWRVARWMADIAGPNLLAELSHLDLMMLLLSAYLHDIGMTPPLGQLNAHEDFLLTGERGNLTEDQAGELQEWLDNEKGGIEPPIVTGLPTNEDMGRARQLAAEYVRHRHNDWSELWTREYFKDSPENPYEGWVDDLVLLCKSHHFNIDELLDEKFDPREIGDEKTVLHLRYCACLLRLGDILDFDPERTPPILFSHREIEGDSVIHWHKNLGVSFKHEGNQLSLRAEPEKAVIHHAILSTIADVDRELAVCRQLDDRTNFQRLPGSEVTLPHQWVLELGVKHEVNPKNHAYEYIDGTFRPDTERLLQLLGGTELYGTELVAVREILQNAFDAVREQIARERLQETEPGSEQTRARIAAEHSVSLEVQQSESGLRLTCRDSGVGMSRERIAGRFLVGGTVAGHDVRGLERECERHGFSIGRTARFGIGVLSYFLLASKLIVHTRRSREAGNPDDSGWTFTSRGLADFGQLERISDPKAGTAVEIEVRSDVISDGAQKFVEELFDYVSEIVRRTPCPFSFKAESFDVAEINWNGWVDRTGEARTDFAQEGWLEEVQAEALKVNVHEGTLPSQLGVFRIYQGLFEFEAGTSMVGISLKAAGKNRYLVENEGNPSLIGGHVKHSWNGMEISVEDAFDLESLPLNTQIEIDWTANRAGRLSVDRKSFNPRPPAAEAVEFVCERARDLLRDQVSKQETASPYGLVNTLFAEAAFEEKHKGPSKPYWQHIGGSDSPWYFKPVKTPIIDSETDPDSEPLEWRGKPVHPMATIELMAPGSGRDFWQWNGAYRPQCVGVIRSGERFEPVAIWEKLESYDGSDYRPHRRTAKFPSEWRGMVGMVFPADRGSPWLWNQDHPLLRAVDNASWEWAEETFLQEPEIRIPEVRDSSLNPLAHREELLSSEGRVAAWMLMCLERCGGDFWSELGQGKPDIRSEAWRKVDGLLELGPLLLLNKIQTASGLTVVTPSTWEIHRENLVEELLQELDVPNDEWLVTPPKRAPIRRRPKKGQR